MEYYVLVTISAAVTDECDAIPAYETKLKRNEGGKKVESEGEAF